MGSNHNLDPFLFQYTLSNCSSPSPSPSSSSSSFSLNSSLLPFPKSSPRNNDDSSKWSSTSFPPSSAAVLIPCAACEILCLRCTNNCVLAPYFPPHQAYNFSTVHKVFGATNIISFLQELPESQRAEAVKSMIYEAKARIEDPVYGCTGAISQLQQLVNMLQEQLAKTQADLENMKSQQVNFLSLLSMEMAGQELIFLEKQYRSLDNLDSSFPSHTDLDMLEETLFPHY